MNWRDAAPVWVPNSHTPGRLIGIEVDECHKYYRVAFGIWFGQFVSLVPRRAHNGGGE